MGHNRFAQRAAWGCPVLVFVCLAQGCGESATGEYRAYEQLSKAPDKVRDKSVVAVEKEPTTEAESLSSHGESATGSEETAQDVRSAQTATSKKNAVREDTGRSQTPTDGSSARQAVSRQRPGAAEDSTKPSSKSAARKPRVLVDSREFQVEGPQNAIRVTYDDIDLLKVLNMDPVTPEAPELMPSWLKNLDGTRIRIRGFMYPPPLETGIRAFAMARDNQICCFGKNPKIYDLFPVFLREGVTTDYILNRPFDVVGVFHINPIVEEGELQRIYEIDDAIVIDK